MSKELDLVLSVRIVRMIKKSISPAAPLNAKNEMFDYGNRRVVLGGASSFGFFDFFVDEEGFAGGLHFVESADETEGFG